MKPSLERRRIALLAWLLTAVIGAAFGPRPARGAEGERSIAAGREAFNNAARFPWYDARQDALQPITVHPAGGAPPVDFDLGFLRPVAWFVLAVVLVLLVLAAVYAYRNRGAAAAAGRGRTEGATARAAVEALGFLADRSQADLLGEARQHYREGNYSEAIIYLFSYQLVELDRSSLVRLAKGKTNRQYVREAAQVPALGEALALTMTAFEGVFFGRRALDRPSFEACWGRLPEFERLTSRTVS